ncbi:MAG: hypothetical protein ACYDDB_04525 [bacterium]
MKKTINVILLFLFIFAGIGAGSGIAYANSGCMHRTHGSMHTGHAMKKGIFKLIKKLRLTHSQLMKLRLIKKEEFKSFKKNAMNFKNPMINAMKSGNFNKRVFVSDSINNAKNRAGIKAAFLESFFKILTPQQRQKFISITKNKIKHKIKHLEFMKKIIENRIKIMKSHLNN